MRGIGVHCMCSRERVRNIVFRSTSYIQYIQLLFLSFSTTSMRVDSSFSSAALMPTADSVADVHDHTTLATDIDDISECSDLDAQLNLSIQIQMAAMLSFAYIWSLGAFVPFR